MKNKAIGFSFASIWCLGFFFALLQFPDVDTYWFIADGALVFSLFFAFAALIEWSR